MKGGSKKETGLVALLRVESSEGDGVQLIKSFDAAWHRALELPTPVRITLVGFVRK